MALSDGFFTTSTSFSTWRFPKIEKKITTHEAMPSAKDTKSLRIHEENTLLSHGIYRRISMTENSTPKKTL